MTKPYLNLSFSQFEDDCFDTVAGLVEHHVKTGLPVSANSGAVLIRGVPREGWNVSNGQAQLRNHNGSGRKGSYTDSGG